MLELSTFGAEWRESGKVRSKIRGIIDASEKSSCQMDEYYLCSVEIERMEQFLAGSK